MVMLGINKPLMFDYGSDDYNKIQGVVLTLSPLLSAVALLEILVQGGLYNVLQVKASVVGLGFQLPMMVPSEL